MPRPELRNHGVGWMWAVERLRNGGVPRNPVFLMPATHCIAIHSLVIEKKIRPISHAAFGAVSWK